MNKFLANFNLGFIRPPKQTLSGQAALEFAILLPVIILIIVGFIIVGLWMIASQIVTHAVFEGLNTAILTNDKGSVEAIIDKNMEPISSHSKNYKIAPIPELNTAGNYGKPLTVTIIYTMPLPVEFGNVFKSDTTSKHFNTIQVSMTGRTTCNETICKPL